MSRYIRYKYQKQQINFMNCCDIDDWVDTNNKRITGFDSICGNKDYDFYGNNKTYIKVQLNDQWRDIETPPQWYGGWANPVKIYFESFSNIGVPNSISRMRVYVYGYDMKISFGSDGETDKDFLIIGDRNQDLSIYDSKTILEIDNVTKYSSTKTTQNKHLKTTGQSGTKGTGSTNEEYFIDFVYVKNGDTNVGEDRAYVTLYLPDNFTGSLKKCDCNEVWENEPEVMTRTKKLNPNYEYECIDGNRHYRLQVQESYDKGASWVDTQRFELGDVYEENSEWCNATEIKFKWEYYNEIIKGFEKIINWIKKFSLDGGETWDYLTYIDDNGEVIYEYKQTAMNIDGCGRHSDIEYQIKAAKTTIGACDTSAQPSVMARYRTGKLCCIERNIIWGEWGEWYNLKKGTDYTITMDEIEKNETYLKKVYNYSVQGLGVYGSLSASSTITQMEGPCTPPEEPDIPTPDVPTPDPDVPTPDPEPGMDEYFLWCRYNTAYTESTLNVSDDFELNISTNNKTYVFTDYPEIKTKFYVPQKEFYSGNTNVQFDSTITHLYKFETTKKMTSLKNMFRDAGWLEEINCKDWDVSNVTDLTGAFGVTSPRNTCRLKKLDLSGWDTSNVERTTNMIKAYGLEELNLCNWDVSKMTSPTYNRYPIMVYDNCKIYINKDYAFWYEKLKESGWSDETVRKMLIML